MRRNSPVMTATALIAVMVLAAQVMAKPGAKKGKGAPAESASVSASASASAPVPEGPKPLSESLTGDAKQAYDSAMLLYTDHDYAGASIKFRQAYDISKDPRLLWNEAACEKNLRHYARVLKLVEQYQVEAASMITEADKNDAKDLANAVRAFVGTLAVSSPEESVSISVDDEPMGVAPLAGPLVLSMGARKVKCSKAGFTDFETTVQLGGGATAAVICKMVKEVHEGRLVVVAGANETIWIDSKAVGTGRWQGVLASGGHTLRVTAPGMRSHQTEITIKDKDAREVRVMLEKDQAAAPGGSKTWMWITGGAVLVAGAVLGGYFLLKPKDETAPGPNQGTMNPGTVQLPLFR
jgi:hypothetical protein